MKLRVPAGCGAVSHLGRSLEIAEDNSIEVDDADWPALSAHGFRLWEEEDLRELASMNREELIVAAMNATLRALQTIGTEEIRTRLTASEASVLPFEQTSGVAGAGANVNASAESVSALSRQGLFAFLKGRGVSVSLPVTNEELRAMARQAMGLA
ncbi:conserved hypothetical protein [Methylocella tundrae]|uniref:Uncharacterized protein n=1 Tax=Methylocella tundrae TaxID=227605 RepID=A0A4U8Z4A1_METTU|nr:hypothetical protein [Methylocella tundrae]WPP04021.1 hypothetical protein SIN04_16410 [Methylocella tundrae]VFU10249.1 conserved protein of unknown function [Methylocella tundrae]VTZ49262.1 conserved hypothetical protein [Methylocella tundrae]